MNYSGNTLKVSGLNPFDKTYSFLQSKFEKEIINILMGILEKNISVVETPLITNVLMYHRNPDNWILEQIVNGTAQISSTAIILTPDSPPIVDYSYAIGTFRPQLYYKAKTLRENTNIYLAPFSIKLWISLIAAVVLLTLTLIFILSREAKLPHEISYDVFARLLDIKEDRDENWTEDTQETTEESLIQREKWEMGEILLVCFGAICQQGSARDPSTNAARLLLLVLFILAVVGYTAYSASIISLISLFPSTEYEETHHIDNFSEEFQILLHSIHNIQKYFNLSFKEIEFADPRKGFEKAIKGEAAFVGDRDVSLNFFNQQKYTSDVRCTLGRVYLGVQYHKVFAIKIGNPYKEKINKKQFGLLDRERKRFYNIHSPCTFLERSSRTIFVSFNGEDVKPVVKLFQFGLITSLALLLSEFIVYYCPKGIHKIFFKSLYNKCKKQTQQKKINSRKNVILQNKRILQSEDMRMNVIKETENFSSSSQKFSFLV